jgi:N-acyl-D-amino-acid deacylase
LIVALAVVLDLVLSGGRVVDGTGAPWFRADVGIRGDRIVAVGDLSRTGARRRIELRDRMVAPGFIDMLGQSERFLLADDRVESKIRQGITTEITGEGESIAPTAPRLLVEAKPFDDRYGIRVDWSDLNGYFQRFRATVNLGTFFGAATSRALVLGYGDVEPNPAQLQMMQRLVREAIEQGALGLSTALIYPPGSFARTPELIELAKVAARHGGIYASHVRGEAGTLFAALDEAIAIGREARIPVEVWHLKVAGRDSWAA